MLFIHFSVSKTSTTGPGQDLLRLLVTDIQHTCVQVCSKAKGILTARLAHSCCVTAYDSLCGGWLPL